MKSLRLTSNGVLWVRSKTISKEIEKTTQINPKIQIENSK